MPKIDTYSVCHPGVEFYFWRIEESVEELAALIDGGDELLAEARCKFKAAERQREWLAARALLQHSGYNVSALAYMPGGAPCLRGSGRHISISHTRGLAVIAISKRPVGIDIENEGRDASKAIRKVADNSDAVICDGEALRMWTAKEAAFKFNPVSCVTIKDIRLEKAIGSDSYAEYRVAYPDDTSAVCRTYGISEYVLSCCTEE